MWSLTQHRPPRPVTGIVLLYFLLLMGHSHQSLMVETVTISNTLGLLSILTLTDQEHFIPFIRCNSLKFLIFYGDSVCLKTTGQYQKNWKYLSSQNCKLLGCCISILSWKQHFCHSVHRHAKTVCVPLKTRNTQFCCTDLHHYRMSGPIKEQNKRGNYTQLISTLKSVSNNNNNNNNNYYYYYYYNKNS
jgi:hypothetical protein